MSTIEYYTPTRVIFGKGAENSAGKILKEIGARKVLIHYGGGSAIESGLMDRVTNSLETEQIEFFMLGGVKPNPRLSLVREGIDIIKAKNIDSIIAVGGGSVLDSAKAIGYGAFNDGDVWDFYCGKRTPDGTLPVGCVLTLSATGSEMSDSSVINNDEGDIVLKRGCNSPFGRLKFSLLNPELTYTVSKYQTASGSVDVMMHTLERYFHKGYTLDLTDELSFTILKTVMKYAPIALKEPNNYDARANLMWAGSLSHNGLTNAGNENRGDWACHQIEHELSAEHDVTHGAGLAAIWGSWARWVISEDEEKFVKLGISLFGEKDPYKCIELMENFFKSIDMPTNLNELGLNFDEESCRFAAKGVTFQDARTVGSFKVLTTEDIYNIYLDAAGLK